MQICCKAWLTLNAACPSSAQYETNSVPKTRVTMQRQLLGHKLSASARSQRHLAEAVSMMLMSAIAFKAYI